MRLYVEDTYTFPESTRDDIQRAFDAFETVMGHYPTLCDQIGDFDLAADLGGRELTFTGFVDVTGDEPPRYYVQQAHGLLAKAAGTFMWEWDLPRSVVNNRFTVRAAFDAFLATGSLVFDVPAPAE